MDEVSTQASTADGQNGSPTSDQDAPHAIAFGISIVLTHDHSHPCTQDCAQVSRFALCSKDGGAIPDWTEAHAQDSQKAVGWARGEALREHRRLPSFHESLVTELTQAAAASAPMLRSVECAAGGVLRNPGTGWRQWQRSIQIRGGRQVGGSGPYFWDGYRSLLWQRWQPGWSSAPSPISTSTRIRRLRLHYRRLPEGPRGGERVVGAALRAYSDPAPGRPVVSGHADLARGGAAPTGARAVRAQREQHSAPERHRRPGWELFSAA